MIIYELRVMSYELRVENFLGGLRVTFCELKLKIKSCQSISRVLHKVVLLCNFIEIRLRHGLVPVNFLHNFRAPFPKNASGGLLLLVSSEKIYF